MRTCKHCGGSDFRRSVGRICRKCENAAARVKYYADLERNRESRRRYIEAYRRRRGVKPRKKGVTPEDPESASARSRSYYWANREERLAYMAEYRKTESFKAAASRYAKANRIKLRQRHRARRYRLASGSFSSRDWERLCERWGNACAYCSEKTKLTIDHVVPLARGGSNYIGNILPACLSCNSGKRDRFIMEWRTIKTRRTAA